MNEQAAVRTSSTMLNDTVALFARQHEIDPVPAWMWEVASALWFDTRRPDTFAGLGFGFGVATIEAALSWCLVEPHRPQALLTVRALGHSDAVYALFRPDVKLVYQHADLVGGLRR